MQAIFFNKTLARSPTPCMLNYLEKGRWSQIQKILHRSREEYRVGVKDVDKVNGYSLLRRNSIKEKFKEKRYMINSFFQSPLFFKLFLG